MSSTSIIALAIVAVVTVLARVMVRYPGLARLRALFPSWRFFDRATTSPQLQRRIADAAGELGPWAPIDVGPRPTGSWAFAPTANLALAYQNAVDHLVQELAELPIDDAADAPAEGASAIETDPRVTTLVSYELVTRIARAGLPPGRQVQWKIVVPDVGGATDYLVSPVIAT